MIKLSKWASLNPNIARTIIVFGHILFVANALFLGFLTFSVEIEFPNWPFALFIGLFLLTFLFYPLKNKSGSWSQSYNYRKSMDFGLVLFTSIFLMIGFNQFCFEPMPLVKELVPTNTARAEFMVYGKDKKAKQAIAPNFLAKVKQTKKEFNRAIKQRIKVLRKSLSVNKKAGIPAWAQTLMIIGSFLISIVLLYFLAILSCSLSCGGSTGAAYVLLFGGLAAILVGLFFLIRLIVIKGEGYKGKRKKSKNRQRVKS